MLLVQPLVANIVYNVFILILDERDYDLECGYEEGEQTPGFLLRMLSHVCTFLSYTGI